MPTGSEAFWGMPDISGLRPCARTHLKKTLCRTHPFSGARDKHSRHPERHTSANWRRESGWVCLVSGSGYSVKVAWRGCRGGSTIDTEDYSQGESSRVIFLTRSQTTDAQRNITKSMAFSPQDQDHLTPLCLTHLSQTAKNTLHPLTSWPLSDERREPVSFLIYRLLFIQINEIKSNSFVRCLLQPYDYL